MDFIIKIFLPVIFFGFMLLIGFLCRKSTLDVDGFVLGGRNVGPWLTAFAYGTSYFSAVVFIGYAGQFGWKFGIAATWAGIGNAFLGSLLAWAVLGKRTRVMTHHLATSTMPQFFEKRFCSPALRTASAFIIFVFLIPYTASLYNGLSRLFAMAFKVDYAYCVIIMAVLTGIYVIVGGYMATAVNDFFQGIIMLFGIIIIIIAVLKGQGGLHVALESLANVSDPSVSTQPGVFASLLGPDPIGLIGVVILTSLGTWGLPQMIQKFYAIKNEKAINTGMIISTIFALIVAGGCYFLGGFGRLFNSRVDVSIEGFDAIIPAMLEDLPVLLLAIVVMLVLSASMSTLSSLVLTSSSTLTLDFLHKRSNDVRSNLFTIRVLIVCFITLSAILAIIQYRFGITFIAQFMGISWGALAGAFLAPFLYGLYWKRCTVSACWTCFIFTFIVMLANIFCRSTFPQILQSPINAGAFCMLAGLVIVPIVSVFTLPPSNESIEDIFSCFELDKSDASNHAVIKHLYWKST